METKLRFTALTINIVLIVICLGTSLVLSACSDNLTTPVAAQAVTSNPIVTPTYTSMDSLAPTGFSQDDITILANLSSGLGSPNRHLGQVLKIVKYTTTTIHWLAFFKNISIPGLTAEFFLLLMPPNIQGSLTGKIVNCVAKGLVACVFGAVFDELKDRAGKLENQAKQLQSDLNRLLELNKNGIPVCAQVPATLQDLRTFKSNLQFIYDLAGHSRDRIDALVDKYKDKIPGQAIENGIKKEADKLAENIQKPVGPVLTELSQGENILSAKCP